jgi:hypothetical protein
MNTKQLLQKVVRKGRHELVRARSRLVEPSYQKIASEYDFRGYKRIYLVHIRKTGGTSLNHMFLSLMGDEASSIYGSLVANAPTHRVLRRGRIYVGWNVDCINRGNYFYAFSHTPLHELNLPPETFTVTCFRDPVKRVISHYNMLMDCQVNNIDHPCMATEGKWLGEKFDDFLERVPRDQLLNQLYMFSRDFDVDWSVEQVRNLSHYFFSDNFAYGIESLNQKTGLSLEPIHIRKTNFADQISEENIARLREMLSDEYAFLDRVRELDSRDSLRPL